MALEGLTALAQLRTAIFGSSIPVPVLKIVISLTRRQVTSPEIQNRQVTGPGNEQDMASFLFWDILRPLQAGALWPLLSQEALRLHPPCPPGPPTYTAWTSESNQWLVHAWMLPRCNDEWFQWSWEDQLKSPPFEITHSLPSPKIPGRWTSHRVGWWRNPGLRNSVEYSNWRDLPCKRWIHVLFKWDSPRNTLLGSRIKIWSFIMIICSPS